LIFRVFWVDAYLAIPGRHPGFVGYDPDLQKGDLPVRIMIVFAVADPGTRTHDLYIPLPDDGGIPKAVAVFQGAFQRDGDNLHIAVGVGSEATCRGDPVIVQDAEGSELHPLRVVVSGEAEAVVAFQPSMVGISAAIGRVDYFFHGVMQF
jgi:hypothetical protein